MFKTTIVVLVLIFAASIMYAQIPMCLDGSSFDRSSFSDWLYSSSPAFSADNVHRACATGANPSPVIEARWHKTIPILVMMSRTDDTEENPLIPYFGVMDMRENIGRFSAIDRTFAQLEITLDKIVIGTTNGSLKVWDLWQEEFLYEHPVSYEEVTELLLHPIGEWLLVVIDHKKPFRFDLESRAVTEIHLQGNEDHALNALAFSSDGLLLAAAGKGSIGIWDTDSWEAWEPHPLSAEWVGELHFTDDDSQLIVLADASVSRWSLSGKNIKMVRELVSLLPKRQCLNLGGDISPDGTLLMTTDDCGRLRAWDLTIDTEIFVPQMSYLAGHPGGMPTKFSSDGRFLLDRSDTHSWTWYIIAQSE